MDPGEKYLRGSFAVKIILQQSLPAPYPDKATEGIFSRGIIFVQKETSESPEVSPLGFLTMAHMNKLTTIFFHDKS